MSRIRTLPIRWRLAGGSAALTLAILLVFALGIGSLLSDRLTGNFRKETASAATTLQAELQVGLTPNGWRLSGVNIDDYAASQKAHIRVLSYTGDRIDDTPDAPDVGVTAPGSATVQGEQLETRLLRASPSGYALLQYSRSLGSLNATVGRMWFLLLFGVLAGAGLALLAGLALARQAMRPVADLTSAAQRIATTGDSSLEIPIPQSNDEIHELAVTLSSALSEVDQARLATEASLERQKAFVGDASHELRTPLTSLIGNLELLESDAPEQIREDATSSLRAARRMARIVADLLTLAKGDTPEARIQECSLADVIQSAINDASARASAHTVSSSDDGSLFTSDRDSVVRALRNLIENAALHTPPGTKIHIGGVSDESSVVLTVADSGAGIPPADQTRIFDRFFRAAGDTAGSTGLGLAIVKSTAESLGGSISVGDSELGGACFTLRLPR
ncbi:MAG: HAMP domain-containing sensor histidine kinase [Actinomycetes bacterium]